MFLSITKEEHWCSPSGMYFYLCRLQMAISKYAEYTDNWYESLKKDTFSRLTWISSWENLYTINYLYRNLRAICHALGCFSF